MAKSRLHIVPVQTKLCRICLHAVQNFAKFRENVEIPQKWANSSARIKILHSAETVVPRYDRTDSCLTCTGGRNGGRDGGGW